MGLGALTSDTAVVFGGVQVWANWPQPVSLIFALDLRKLNKGLPFNHNFNRVCFGSGSWEGNGESRGDERQRCKYLG